MTNQRSKTIIKEKSSRSPVDGSGMLLLKWSFEDRKSKRVQGVKHLVKKKLLKSLPIMSFKQSENYRTDFNLYLCNQHACYITSIKPKQWYTLSDDDKVRVIKQAQKVLVEGFTYPLYLKD